MVPKLRTVLTFLKIAGIPIPTFETSLNLPQGSMQKFLEEKIELTPELMSKIVTKYNKEINEQGYYTIDLTPFKGQGIGMMYALRDKDNPFDANTDEHTNWLIDHRIKQGKAQLDSWLKIEILGIELPMSITNSDYHTILDTLTEENYTREETSSTDVLIFRVRKDFKEKIKTTIYIDPKDGHSEHVFWTVG